MEYDVGIGSKLGVNVLYNEQTESNDLEVNINGQTSRASFDTDFKMLASDLIAAHSIPMGNFDLRFAYSFSSWDAKVNDARVTGHHHNIMATLYKQWTAALSSELSLQKVYHPDPIILSTDRIRRFDYIAAELRYRFLESSELSIGIGKISYGERSEARSVSLRYEYEFGVKKTKRRKRSYKIPTPLYRIRMDASILRDTVSPSITRNNAWQNHFQ